MYLKRERELTERIDLKRCFITVSNDAYLNQVPRGVVVCSKVAVGNDLVLVVQDEIVIQRQFQPDVFVFRHRLMDAAFQYFDLLTRVGKENRSVFKVFAKHQKLILQNITTPLGELIFA